MSITIYTGTSVSCTFCGTTYRHGEKHSCYERATGRLKKPKPIKPPRPTGLARLVRREFACEEPDEYAHGRMYDPDDLTAFATRVVRWAAGEARKARCFSTEQIIVEEFNMGRDAAVGRLRAAVRGRRRG